MDAHVTSRGIKLTTLKLPTQQKKKMKFSVPIWNHGLYSYLLGPWNFQFILKYPLQLGEFTKSIEYCLVLILNMLLPQLLSHYKLLRPFKWHFRRNWVTARQFDPSGNSQHDNNWDGAWGSLKLKLCNWCWNYQ